jgi:hypothetical protein
MNPRSAKTASDLSHKYSIYLNTKEKDALVNIDPYQSYIIDMNDKLRCEYDDMKEKLTEANLEIEQRNDELDREEKSSTNLRGATHNINALNQLNKKIKDQYVLYQAHTSQLIETRNAQLQSLITDHRIFILLSIFTCMIMWYMDIITYGHVIFHITWHVIGLSMMSCTKNTRILGKSDNVDSDMLIITNKYMPVIKQHISDIKELLTANDYLSEYIDSL